MITKIFIVALTIIAIVNAEPDGECPEVDPVDKTVYLTDKANCAGYYACSGGYAVHLFCSQGTYWDPDTEFCEVGPKTAKCGDRPTTVAPLWEKDN